MTTKSPSRSEVAVKVVDTDVHPDTDLDNVVEYLAEPWRSRYYGVGVNESHWRAPLYLTVSRTQRVDAVPENGGKPGSDPALLEKHVFVEAGVDFAILIPLSFGSRIEDSGFEAAILAAQNAYFAETWLTRYNWHGRYWGSIRVSAEDPVAASREIEKWAGHPRVAQIYIAPYTTLPLGHPQFHPIWEAAARSGLPVAFHPNAPSGMRWLTPVGFASYLLEAHPHFSLPAMAHIMSFVFEGVLERFPTLRIAWVEQGFSWLVPFMWRLDNHWRAFGSEVPHVRRPPSEYIKEHMRFTTQPIEDVVPFTDLVRIMEWMDAERMLMFATDYPHHDFDNPKWLEPQLPKGWLKRIFSQNALDFYGLPRTRPADALDEPRPDAPSKRKRALTGARVGTQQN